MVPNIALKMRSNVYKYIVSLLERLFSNGWNVLIKIYYEEILGRRGWYVVVDKSQTRKMWTSDEIGDSGITNK